MVERIISDNKYLPIQGTTEKLCKGWYFDEFNGVKVWGTYNRNSSGQNLFVPDGIEKNLNRLDLVYLKLFRPI
ncbi:MAG TPA: hypothetical protein VG895_04475 [Patescibacteria group bacterium]|nr:hypothetical protein [Patescibacteria group bacterium]